MRASSQPTVVRRPVGRRTLPLLAAILAGCTAGPDYHRPVELTAAATPPSLVEATGSAFDPGPVAAGWWRLYADPALDALIDQALRRNTSLRAALATLEQAQAALRLAERERTPLTTLSANPTYGQASADALLLPQEPPPGPIYQIGALFSFDFDVAGRLRRTVEQVRDQVGASEAALDVARVTVAASTAGAYTTVCATGLEIVVTDRSIATARQNLDVIQRRFDAGLNGINDVVRARVLLEQTIADRPALVARNRSALYMLATLTGDPPERVPADVSGCVAPPLLRQPIPVGDGRALLRRRPDVRQAERQVAAAVAGIGIVTADLYPSITLSGTVGTTATSFADIFRDRGFRWNIGPLLQWQFPNISITRARIEIADAAARQSLAQFDGTVLNALRDTETSLVTLARALDTEDALRRARDDAALAAGNVDRLYRGGVGQFIDILDAERTQIQAENALAQATARVAQGQVDLFQALGGGWQQVPPVHVTPLERVATPGPGY